MIDARRIRDDFPIFEREINGRPLVYLDNAATTQKPRAVIERIARFYSEEYANIHRSGHALAELAGAAYEEARSKVAEYLGAADPSEIIFTPGTTAGINMAARSFGEAFVGPGDEIVVTLMEHHSNLLPWRILCERKGASLRIAPLLDDGTLDLEALDGLIGEKTSLVAVTHVSNVLGTVNPVEEIVRLASDRSARVLVDGAQAVQHIPVDVGRIGCDLYAFSGHKVFAGTGIGVLYGRKEILESMPPADAGGGMVTSVTVGGSVYAGLPLRFEAGTPDFAGAAGLSAAIEYISGIGLEEIASHEHDLMDYAVDRLRSLSGMTVYGDPPDRCGSIPFNLEGIHPHDAALVLDGMGIAVRAGKHCAEPLVRHLGAGGTLRASFALYNSRDDVDALVDGLERAADILEGGSR